MTAIDLDGIRAAAYGRVGDVLLAFGAKVVGSPERGRASCPAHGGDGLNSSFGNGLVTCHSGCGGTTRDALGLVAAVTGRDLHRPEDLRETAAELAAILGVRIEDDGTARSRAPRLVAPLPVPAPTVDSPGLWGALARRDGPGEVYLRGRGLLVDPLPEFVRFNRRSADPWLAARERDGFVLAFGAHRADGTLGTISLRFIGPGDPPPPWKKAITLKGASTAGAAICRSDVALLAGTDPEFARDEIVLVEGGPDAIAATILFEEAAADEELPATWALGAIGCTAAPATLSAFAPVVRGRTVHVALDVDPAGEEWAQKAITAAWEAGAARVTRLRPPAGKDLAEFLAGRAA
ncbi:MAG: toprim domain-containing protein [Thermoanaerobaculia bacterium]